MAIEIVLAKTFEDFARKNQEIFLKVGGLTEFWDIAKGITAGVMGEIWLAHENSTPQTYVLHPVTEIEGNPRAGVISAGRNYMTKTKISERGVCFEAQIDIEDNNDHSIGIVKENKYFLEIGRKMIDKIYIIEPNFIPHYKNMHKFDATLTNVLLMYNKKLKLKNKRTS